MESWSKLEIFSNFLTTTSNSNIWNEVMIMVCWYNTQMQMLMVAHGTGTGTGTGTGPPCSTCLGEEIKKITWSLPIQIHSFKSRSTS
jgi:hypothetical protein